MKEVLRFQKPFEPPLNPVNHPVKTILSSEITMSIGGLFEGFGPELTNVWSKVKSVFNLAILGVARLL